MAENSTPSMDTNKSNSSQTRESSKQTITLEQFGKIGTSFAIVCYIIGLIVVNIYLYQLGVSDFSLFKVRFIYTGALAMLPLLVSTLPFSFIALIDIKLNDKKEKEEESIWTNYLRGFSKAYSESKKFRWIWTIGWLLVPGFVFGLFVYQTEKDFVATLLLSFFIYATSVSIAFWTLVHAGVNPPTILLMFH